MQCENTTITSHEHTTAWVLICTRNALFCEDQVRFEPNDVFTDLLNVFFLHLQDAGEVFLTSDLNVSLKRKASLGFFNQSSQIHIQTNIVYWNSISPDSRPSCTPESSPAEEFWGSWWVCACVDELHPYSPSHPLAHRSPRWSHQEPIQTHTLEKSSIRHMADVKLQFKSELPKIK